MTAGEEELQEEQGEEGEERYGEEGEEHGDGGGGQSAHSGCRAMRAGSQCLCPSVSWRMMEGLL